MNACSKLQKSNSDNVREMHIFRICDMNANFPKTPVIKTKTHLPSKINIALQDYHLHPLFSDLIQLLPEQERVERCKNRRLRREIRSKQVSCVEKIGNITVPITEMKTYAARKSGVQFVLMIRGYVV